MTPREPVSVCMATYNGAKFLGEQLDSILCELEAQDELIIVDDRSTDGTDEIARKYSSSDPRIRFFPNPRNEGVRRTFARAISIARNEIIFLSDQDDLWRPGKIRSALSFFGEGENVVAVLTNAIVRFEGEVEKEKLFFSESYRPRFGLVSQFVRNDFIGCCMCFRRRILEIALPFPSWISMHDWWLGSVAISYGEVRYDGRPGIIYRRHGNNASPGRRRPIWVIAVSRLKDLVALAVLARRRVTARGAL